MLEQTPPWAKHQPPQQDSQFHHYLFVKGNTQQNEIFEESWAHSGLWQQLNFQIQWTQPTFHDDIAKDKHHCVIQLPAVSFWRTLSGWQRKAESKWKKKNQALKHGIIWSWSSGMRCYSCCCSAGLFLTNDLILLLPRLTNKAWLRFCLLNISQMFTHVKIKAYKIKIYYQCISFQGEAWGVAPSPLKRPTLLYDSPHYSLDFLRGPMFFSAGQTWVSIMPCSLAEVLEKKLVHSLLVGQPSSVEMSLILVHANRGW